MRGSLIESEDFERFAGEGDFLDQATLFSSGDFFMILMVLFEAETTNFWKIKHNFLKPKTPTSTITVLWSGALFNFHDHFLIASFYFFAEITSSNLIQKSQDKEFFVELTFT